MLAYYKREFLSYFRSPIGWIAIALYAIISGFYFSSWIPTGGMDLSGEAIFLSGILFMIVPIITMRLFSEEKRTGTDVLMYTSPSDLAGIVVSKYLAALSLFLVMNAVYGIHIIVVISFGGRVDALTIGSFLALILLGSLFIAIGTLASAATENQMVAAMLSFTALLLSQFIGIFSAQFRSLTVSLLSALNVFGVKSGSIANAGVAVEKAINWLDPYAHLDELFVGIIKLQPIVFCVTVDVLIVFIAYRLLEKRRWSQKA